MQSSGRDAGDELAVAIIKVVLVGAGLLLVLIVVVAASVTTGFFRAYTTTGLEGTPTSRTLWTALGVFVAVLAAGGTLMALVPTTTTLVLYACVGAFVLFTCVVQACDWHARKQRTNSRASLGILDTYLRF
jgi:hypothetical protein